MKKIIVTLLMVCIMGFVTTINACEIFAVMGLYGNNITDSTGQNSGDPLFNYFKYIGYNNSGTITQERNGFGMAFYMDSQYNFGEPSYSTLEGTISTPTESIESDRRFAHYMQNATWTPSIYNPNTTNLQIMGHNIPYDQMRTVIAHKRRASSGSDQVADPHPFVYRFNGRSFCFVHNGTITSTQLDSMHTYIDNNLSMLTNDLELDTIFWEGAKIDQETGEVLFLDSAVFYTYLLIHIKTKNMDILRGLHSGLNNLPYDSDPMYNRHNFILTDGDALYVYKNGATNSDGSGYKLVYKHDPLQKIAIVSSRNLNTANADYMFDMDTAIEINQRSLVYIPTHGDYVTFDNFVSEPTDQRITIEQTFSDLRSRWFWRGFPLVDTNLTMRVLLTNIFSKSTYVQGENPMIIKKIESQNGVTYYDPLRDRWVWTEDFSEPANANFGTKIEYEEGISDFSYSGYLSGIFPYTESFTAGNKYWVTYNLTNNQTLKSALGQHFSKIRRVYAQNWTYNADSEHEGDQNRYDIAPWGSLTNRDRPMEFSKTYILELKSGVSPITNFQWADSRSATRTLNMPSEFFEYVDKLEYEAIEIFGINDALALYEEIGVFANGDCIGATKVEEFPVQILIYSEGYEGCPLVFKGVDIYGNVTEIDPIVEVVESKSGEKTKKVLIAGQVDYVVATLENKKVNVIPASISQHSNYPNPFNPTTNINFTLTNQGNVSIVIYNIRGQRVATIFEDNLPTGKHSVTWEGYGEDSKTLASGVYLYKISTDSNHVLGKMVLLK